MRFYIHICFLFHSIKGTFATLYTNIVEASLQHFHHKKVFHNLINFHL